MVVPESRILVLILKFFLKIFFDLFLERGKRDGEREGEKYQLVAPPVPPTRDLALIPGRYPDWESNPPPFGSQASTQSIEPQQPGLFSFK